MVQCYHTMGAGLVNSWLMLKYITSLSPSVLTFGTTGCDLNSIWYPSQEVSSSSPCKHNIKKILCVLHQSHIEGLKYARREGGGVLNILPSSNLGSLATRPHHFPRLGAKIVLKKWIYKCKFNSMVRSRATRLDGLSMAARKWFLTRPSWHSRQARHHSFRPQHCGRLCGWFTNSTPHSCAPYYCLHCFVSILIFVTI